MATQQRNVVFGASPEQFSLSRSQVRVSAGYRCLVTLGKLFTSMYLCHQAVKVGTGRTAGEQADTPRDALAPCQWTRSVSQCLAEGY